MKLTQNWINTLSLDFLEMTETRKKSQLRLVRTFLMSTNIYLRYQLIMTGKVCPTMNTGVRPVGGRQISLKCFHHFSFSSGNVGLLISWTNLNKREWEINKGFYKRFIVSRTNVWLRRFLLIWIGNRATNFSFWISVSMCFFDFFLIHQFLLFVSPQYTHMYSFFFV